MSHVDYFLCKACLFESCILISKNYQYVDIDLWARNLLDFYEKIDPSPSKMVIIPVLVTNSTYSLFLARIAFFLAHMSPYIYIVAHYKRVTPISC